MSFWTCLFVLNRNLCHLLMVTTHVRTTRDGGLNQPGRGYTTNFAAHLHHTLQPIFTFDRKSPVPGDKRKGKNRFGKTRIKHFPNSGVNIKAAKMAIKGWYAFLHSASTCVNWEAQSVLDHNTQVIVALQVVWLLLAIYFPIKLQKATASEQVHQTKFHIPDMCCSISRFLFFFSTCVCLTPPTLNDFLHSHFTITTQQSMRVMFLLSLFLFSQRPAYPTVVSELMAPKFLCCNSHYLT